jgi:CheY-like chemotaxis protein
MRCARSALALLQAASFRPDVVLLDVTLSLMDGYEVCRRLRSASGGRPRLIALSGHSRLEESGLKDAGFDGFLAKPVEMDRVLEVLSQLASDARQEHE